MARQQTQHCSPGRVSSADLNKGDSFASGINTTTEGFFLRVFNVKVYAGRPIRNVAAPGPPAPTCSHSACDCDRGGLGAANLPENAFPL